MNSPIPSTSRACPAMNRSGNASMRSANASMNASFQRNMAKPDVINSEFLYYSSVLRVVVPALSSGVDRKKINPWVKKLFRPEYHGSLFREKRNKYLLYLTITLLNDEAYGIFLNPPPDGALIDISDIEQEPIPAAEWEMDHTWADTIDGLPENFQALECSVHLNRAECETDHSLDQILDQEFQFLLYIARPYSAMLKGRYERTRVAMWLQTLCTIHGGACSSMRGIRNDYIMALLGYIHDLRLVGPFAEYPPWRTLPPLAEAAKTAAESKPITDPTGPEATEFLSTQPVPKEGAFCYIAITGDLVESSLG